MRSEDERRSLVGEPGEAKSRLIIVDDEPVVLDLLVSMFDGSPYEVVGCATGTEALRAIDAGVDVLLTDKNLPDVGGIELVRYARKVRPDCECLIITGYASLDTALQAMELEVFDYIVKPPKDIFDVRRKVQQAFDKQVMVRRNQSLTESLVMKNRELENTLVKLRELQSELIQSEKLAGIGTLAAGIAHEISSPLFGIMGLAEAIQEEEDPKTARGYARDIVDYTRSIRDIVQDLSGYSRAADREYLTTVDLAKVVEDATRLVQRTLKVDALLRVEVEPDLWLQARTSEVQQVFVNLVKNAVEAVQETHPHGGGEVRVSARRIDGQLHATVQDNGPGIPKDRQALIFDPFYTTKAPGRGTGLGLNIVYRIVTKYRGTVTVDSAPGSGAVFHIRFPVGDDA